MLKHWKICMSGSRGGHGAIPFLVMRQAHGCSGCSQKLSESKEWTCVPAVYKGIFQNLFRTDSSKCIDGNFALCFKR